MAFRSSLLFLSLNSGLGDLDFNFVEMDKGGDRLDKKGSFQAMGKGCRQ